VIQQQIRNCTDAIAEGKRYPSLMERLAEMERELADTNTKIEYSEPRAIRLRLRDTRRFGETRLGRLQSLLTGEPRVAGAEIAKHVEKIILAPEGRTYVASGRWDLFGSVAVKMMPGGGIGPNVYPCDSSGWQRHEAGSAVPLGLGSNLIDRSAVEFTGFLVRLHRHVQLSSEVMLEWTCLAARSNA
jgi:hypothetical protein